MASKKPPTTGNATVSMLSANGKDGLPSNDAKGSSSERLPSFRLPRDLTLGGMQLKGSVARPNLLQNNRKVYTPNLNAVRNKNVDVKTSRDTTRSTTRGRGRGAKGPNDRSNSNSSRGRNNNVISSVGLFSQGAGDGATKQLYRSFRGSDESSSAAQLRRPTISAKREKIDPVAERQRIAEIYDLDGDVEESNGDDLMEGGIYAPIILTEPKLEIKIEDRLNDMNIKTETETEISDDPDQRTNEKYPTNIREFFERPSSQFFLMQLPDTLPGHGDDPEPGDSAEAEQLNGSIPWNSMCTMNNAEEGQIGRLVRYRSGKTKLIINDVQFDIALGINPNHLQEIISIDADVDRRTSDMINIGQIGANLCAVPDWESINLNGEHS